MTPIGRAATAYKAEIDDLGKATFAAHDNLKVPIEQTGKALDIMAQAGKSGAFEVEDMAQYFPEFTASMQSLGSKGVPAVADLAAALQITRKGAGDSASAANNLKNRISKINAGDTIKNFAKFGIDIPAAMKKAAKDGRSPIEQIVRLTQQATGGDQAKLSTLFGDMQVQQALRPLMSAFSEYQAIRTEALGTSGTVNTHFADRMSDSAEKVKRLQIQAKDLSTTFGDQLLPMVASASDRFSKWETGIADVARRHPNLNRAAGVATGALAALLLVVGGGAIVLAALVAPFAALAGAATLLGIGLLPLIGIAAGMVLGIGALAAAGYLVYSKWDSIAGWFGEVWSEITGYFSGGIGGITAFLVNFSPMDLLYGGMAKLLSWLGIDVPARLSQVGSQMIQSLISGISSGWSALKAKITSLANSMPEWVRKILGIHSPSRVFAAIGGHVMSGLDQGLGDGSAGPSARITGLSNKMRRAMAIGGDAEHDETITAPALVARVNDLAGQISRALTAGAASVAIAATPGRVAIDNNAAERAVRPICLGKKNWLFAGSETGAETLASAMTLIESAKMNGLDPQAYITDLLNRNHDHKINRIGEL